MLKLQSMVQLPTFVSCPNATHKRPARLQDVYIQEIEHYWSERNLQFANAIVK